MNHFIHESELENAADLGFDFGSPAKKHGRVNKLGGWNLRDVPRPDYKAKKLLPFNEFVFVDRIYKPNAKDTTSWYHVYTENDSGWVRSDGLNIMPIDLPPETQLKVINPYFPGNHGNPFSTEKLAKISAAALDGRLMQHIKYGNSNSYFYSNLWDIAHVHYKTTSKWGKDTRLFVAGLGYTNRYTDGLKIPKGLDFTDDRAWERLNVLERNTALWMPSKKYVLHLRDQGVISSGSVYYDTYNKIKKFISDIIDAAIEGVGIIAGLVHGALLSVLDIFEDAVGLVKMVGKFIKALFSGEIISLVKKLYQDIKKIISSAPEVAKAIYNDFRSKWNAENAWDKGYFRGTVVGYLLGTTVIVVLTMGAAAMVKFAGKGMRFASIALKVSKQLEKTAVLISKGKQIPAKIKDSMIKVMKDKFDLSGLIPQPAYAMATADRGSRGINIEMPQHRGQNISESRAINNRGTEKVGVEPRARGYAIEDHLIDILFAREGWQGLPDYFPGIDAFKGGFTRKGIRYQADVISIKSTKIHDGKYLETQLEEWLGKINARRYSRSGVTIANPNSRTISLVFEQGHLPNYNQIRPVIEKLKKKCRREKVQFEWHVIPTNGQIIEGEKFFRDSLEILEKL